MKKKHDSKFKAKIALEAIRGDKTIAEIASDYSIHPNQVSQWKKKIIQESADIFSNGKTKKVGNLKDEKDELFKEIGKLKVENEFLKKKYDQLFG